MGLPYVRQGYMTAAVRAVIPFAFGTLRLHRLEAACIPTNAASIRLLENTGFVREGYARDYLCINGMWQDHLLYGRLKEPSLRRGRATRSHRGEEGSQADLRACLVDPYPTACGRRPPLSRGEVTAITGLNHARPDALGWPRFA